MTEHESVLNCLPVDGLHGRRRIYSSKKEITAENVVEVVGKALAVHRINRSEIQYLYDVYRGKQDIRFKPKENRPHINNKVMVNRANEIVTFKSAYFLSETPQYVSAGGDDSVSEKVDRLNTYMRSEDKDSKDKSIVDWMHIAGVGVRMGLPDEVAEEDGSPACIYTLDPRDSFVIYYGGIGNKPLGGVLLQEDEDGKEKACVYTNSRYFEIKNGKITKNEAHALGRVPIVEYPNNDARMGAFEVVLPILNAINTLESNRVDNVQDFVDSFDVFQNCEITATDYENLTSGGKAIMIKTTVPGMESKVYRIFSELNQTGVQTAIDDAYDAVLTICGMPNRNGGSSTSDTGAATMLRDGWQSAESRAKDTEKMWNRSEREFLRLVLHILRDTAELDLKLSDIKIEHARNNLANLQSRMQVLCEGLNNDNIHPKFPWVFAGIPNAEEWYRVSQDYAEEQKKAFEQARQTAAENADEQDGVEEKLSKRGNAPNTAERTASN